MSLSISMQYCLPSPHVKDSAAPSCRRPSNLTDSEQVQQSHLLVEKTLMDSVPGLSICLKLQPEALNMMYCSIDVAEACSNLAAISSLHIHSSSTIEQSEQSATYSQASSLLPQSSKA